MKKHEHSDTPGTSVTACEMKKSNSFFFKDTMPMPASLYVLTVIGVGLAIALHCLSRIVADSSWQWLYLAGLTVLTSCLAIKIPLPRSRMGSLTISISDFCIFGALFVFGPHVAVAIAIIEGIVSSLRVRIKRLYKVLFNISQLSLTAFVVGTIFRQLQSGTILQDSAYTLGAPELLIKTVICSLLYFTLNSFLVATAVALVSIESLALLWKVNFLWVSPTNFFNASCAAVSALATQPIDYAFLLLPLPLILCTFYAYRIRRSRKQDLVLC